jgi:hypothetical protein
MASDYSAPELRRLGTVQELTLQKFNKSGGSTDAICPGVLGSLIPWPPPRH